MLYAFFVHIVSVKKTKISQVSMLEEYSYRDELGTYW